MSDDVLELDFSGVKEFAPFARNVPKGNYVLQVTKIEADESKAGNAMWVVDSTFVDGPHKGEQIREYLALTEKSLFKVKSWLEAQGINVGKKKIKLPNTTATLTSQFVGKTFGAHVDDGDPYVNDKGETVTKSEIKYHMPVRQVAERNQGNDTTDKVTAPTPEPSGDGGEQDPPTQTAVGSDEPEEGGETSSDTSEQLESFDLDNL